MVDGAKSRRKKLPAIWNAPSYNRIDYNDMKGNFSPMTNIFEANFCTLIALLLNLIVERILLESFD